LPIFKGTVWVAIGMLSIGVLILAAIALAASTKLGQVLTLGVTLGLLLLGLLSDWMFGRRILRLEGIIERTADAGGTSSLGELANLLFLKFAYAVVPNFQVFWLADAINQRKAIPLDYVLRAIPYGFLMIAACLLVAIALFQRREIG
jgi:hypothetical protein